MKGVAFTGAEVTAIFSHLRFLLESDPSIDEQLFPFVDWPETLEQHLERFKKYSDGKKSSSGSHFDEKLFKEKLFAQVIDSVDFVLSVQNIGIALNTPTINEFRGNIDIIDLNSVSMNERIKNEASKEERTNKSHPSQLQLVFI